MKFTIRCPKCHKKIDENEMLCPYCGANIPRHNGEVKETYRESFVHDNDLGVEESSNTMENLKNLSIKEKKALGKTPNAAIIIVILFSISIFSFIVNVIMSTGGAIIDTINQNNNNRTENEIVEIIPNTKESLLEQLDILNADREKAYSNALKVMQHNVDALGFSGYQSNGTTIQCLDFSDNKTNQKSMNLIYLFDEREIVYHNNFVNNFSQLSISAIYDELSWIFGVEIDKEDFTAKVYEYIQTTKSLQLEEIYAYTAYEDSQIVIKIAQFNDNGNYTIAFKGSFKADKDDFK